MMNDDQGPRPVQSRFIGGESRSLSAISAAAASGEPMMLWCERSTHSGGGSHRVLGKQDSDAADLPEHRLRRAPERAPATRLDHLRATARLPRAHRAPGDAHGRRVRRDALRRLLPPRVAHHRAAPARLPRLRERSASRSGDATVTAPKLAIGSKFHFDTAAWRSSKRVQKMTYDEKGRYLELLIEQWDHRTIPATPAACADPFADPT